LKDELAFLPPHYRLLLCDLWGCVHDGVHVLPGVVERLDCWAAEERQIIFLTNAPRPSAAVAQQLSNLGLPDRLNGNIVSSGDTALAFIAAEGRHRSFTFLGSKNDAALLRAAGLNFVSIDEADTVVCSGFDQRGFDINDYSLQLRAYFDRHIEMLCLNPDMIVHRAGQIEPCAGTLAEAYRQLGGTVRSFGKPYTDIYLYALRHAARKMGRTPDRNETLAIGDSIATDFTGAANAGIDFVFVKDGIDKIAFHEDPVRLFHQAPGLVSNDKVEPVSIVSGIGLKNGV
jgi:HAD superfamily hydrolase (TIGR01459 family)